MARHRTITLAFTGASGLPYGLRLLDRLIAAGARVYGHPQGIDDLADFVVARVLDQLGVDHSLGPRWGAPLGAPVVIERT